MTRVVDLTNGRVRIALSNIRDGDMRTIGKTGADLEKIRENREKFLNKIGLKTSDTILVMCDYNSENFCRYDVAKNVWRGRGMIRDNDRPDFSVSVSANDALATREPNLGLFLPLADCLGAVIFDPCEQVLCVAHLGRHATEQFGAQRVVEFLHERFGSRTQDLQIWLSPAAGKTNYPLYKFTNQSLREVNISQFVKAGVRKENIFGEDIDTTFSRNYFSHSNFSKGAQKLDGRFAIVAKIV